MRTKLFQIAFHADEAGRNMPIYGVDCHPTLPILATCSNNQKVNLWRIVEKPAQQPALQSSSSASSSAAAVAAAAAAAPTSDDVELVFMFTLFSHTMSVNAVRFSPNGESLASTGDDHIVIVYRPQQEFTWMTAQNERHLHRSFLRGHTADVYDLAWSPDSRHIVSGAVDRTARVWDTLKGKEVAKLEGHAQVVQGVAWDPSGCFIATQSNDRTARVYRTPAAGEKPKKGKAGAAVKARKSDEFTLVATMKSRELAPAQGSGAAADPAAAAASPAAEASSSSSSSAAAPAAAALAARHAMFYDDTFPSFFRRPAFSVEGSLLLLPTGAFKAAAGAPTTPTTYAYRRGHWGAPMAHYPSTQCGKPSVVVRPSPVLYHLRPAPSASSAAAAPPNNGVFALRYRMLHAVASLDTVTVFDSQAPQPVAGMGCFHCEKITDIAWSANGRHLFVASIDGYISMASFAVGEVGEVLPQNHPAYPALLRREKPAVWQAVEAKAQAAAAAKLPADAARAAAGGAEPAGVPPAGGDNVASVTLLPVKRRIALLETAAAAPLPAVGDAAAQQPAAAVAAASPALPAATDIATGSSAGGVDAPV